MLRATIILAISLLEILINMALSILAGISLFAYGLSSYSLASLCFPDLLRGLLGFSHLLLGILSNFLSEFCSCTFPSKALGLTGSFSVGWGEVDRIIVSGRC